MKLREFCFKFPIFQIIYFLLWIPSGVLIASVMAWVTVSGVYLILTKILSAIVPAAFNMFLLSGRMKSITEPWFAITSICYDFLILIVGFELISRILSKKREGYKADDKQN